MKIRSGKEEAFAADRAVNSDRYGARIFSFAEGWANRLEALMVGGVLPIDIISQHADRASAEEDTDGISGYMYGAVVALLAEFWEYGEALRQWHNLKMGRAGERANRTGGTINPALLTIELPPRRPRRGRRSKP